MSRRDRERLTELLHPAFREFGRSGVEYTRAIILDQLTDETKPVEIHAQDFVALELAPSVVLLTYRSANVNPAGMLERYTNRTSIWRLEASGWQMIFHQGTPAEPFARNMT